MKRSTLLIKTGVALSAAGLMAGCAGMGTPPPSFDAAAGPEAQAATFIGDNGKTKHLKGIQKVAVTGCNVLFAETSSATAGTEGGLFSTAGGVTRAEAKVSVYYSLKGVSDADMQKATNEICRDAEQRLTQAGFEVVPTATLQADASFKALIAAGKASPFEYKSPNKGSKTVYKVFAPTGYTVYDPRYIGIGGGLGQAFKAASGDSAAQHEAKLMHNLGVSAVNLSMLVDFAELQSDGGQKGFRLASKDSAEVKHGVNLSITGEISFKPHERLKCYKGWGDSQNCMSDLAAIPTFNSKTPVLIAEQFYKDVVDTTTTGDKLASGFTKALSIVSALGGVSSTSVDITRYDVNVDAGQFMRSSRKGLDGFMDMAFISAKARQ